MAQYTRQVVIHWQVILAAMSLIDAAVDNVGEDRVASNIKTASDNEFDLATCRASVTAATRTCLGKAAKANSKAKKVGWFKSVSAMEVVGCGIVGPDLATSDSGFQAIIDDLFKWVTDGGK
jgi:hypothetical protein